MKSLLVVILALGFGTITSAVAEVRLPKKETAYVVTAPRTKLDRRVIEQLQGYLEKVLNSKVLVVEKLASVPANKPALILARYGEANTLNSPAPPDSPEGYSLTTTKHGNRNIVVALGRTDRGLKRAVYRLILESKQQADALSIPDLKLSEKPWVLEREYALVPWVPQHVRGVFMNPHADNRMVALPITVGMQVQFATLRDLLLREGGKIYFVGDSLTAGNESYPEFMQVIIQSSFPKARIAVVKHGVSGAKMMQLKQLATEDLNGVHTDCVAVFVQDAGLTDRPLPIFEKALKELIHSAGSRKVFVINEGWKPGSRPSQTLIIEGVSLEQWYYYWRKEVNPALLRITRETGSELVDYESTLHRFFASHPDSQIMQEDGLHLATGGKLLLALVCLRSLGFTRNELNLSAIPLDSYLKSSIVRSVFEVQ